MLTTAFNVGTAHPAFSLLRTVTHENRSLFETLNERVLTLSRLRHRPVSALECLEETEWTPDPFPLLPDKKQCSRKKGHDENGHSFLFRRSSTHIDFCRLLSTIFYIIKPGPGFLNTGHPFPPPA